MAGIVFWVDIGGDTEWGWRWLERKLGSRWEVPSLSLLILYGFRWGFLITWYHLLARILGFISFESLRRLSFRRFFSSLGVRTSGFGSHEGRRTEFETFRNIVGYEWSSRIPLIIGLSIGTSEGSVRENIHRKERYPWDNNTSLLYWTIW